MDEGTNSIAAYVPPLRVLRGHVSRSTAYEIDGHRYGVRVSKIRYWVETATRGPKRQQHRVMAQTTNPHQPGSPWNNPWPKSTYFRWVMLCLDPNGQMEWTGVHDFDVTPEFDARLKLSGVHAQLTDRSGSSTRCWRTSHDCVAGPGYSSPAPWTPWPHTSRPPARTRTRTVHLGQSRRPRLPGNRSRTGLPGERPLTPGALIIAAASGAGPGRGTTHHTGPSTWGLHIPGGHEIKNKVYY